MKGIKPFYLIAVLATALFSGAALADRGHGHGHGHSHIGLGFYFGAPYPYPYYYPPYPYYPYYPYPYPPVIAAPASPPEYIERGAEQDEQQPEEYYWYHCNKPEGYYPYVKQCPGGWEQVEPEPER